MNKYKRLLSNTLLFAVGTFSSKLLTLLMARFVTEAMTTDQFGTATNIQNVSNLLIPLFSMQIMDGIIRFGLDRRYRKSDVFSTSVFCVVIGSLALLLFSPLLESIPMLSFFKGRGLMVASFVFCSSIHQIFAQFARARNMVKLYAFQGILATVLTLGFTIIFLYPLRLGVNGFLLGVMVPDLLTAFFLFWAADLKRYFRIRGTRRSTVSQMLRFSIPLIPNKIAFWFTTSINTTFVYNLCGKAASGIFSAAYKIPNIVTMVSTIFLDAWQMSSITEEKDRSQFFSTVFRALSAVILVGSALIILLCRPLMRILAAHDYFSGWAQIPLLVLGTAFACFSGFFGTIYMVEKRSMNNMVTTILGALLNVGLSLVLLPLIGPQGAVVGNLACFSLMFAVRAVDTQRFIRVHFNVISLSLQIVLLLLESYLMISQVPQATLWCALITLLLLAMNLKSLLQAIQKVLPSSLSAKLSRQNRR